MRTNLLGGFVVSREGIVLSACRWDLAPSHCRRQYECCYQGGGIVVSVVRLFCHGQLVGEIIPELWMNDHVAHLRGTVKREQVGELTIVTPNLRQPLIAK